MIKDSYKEGMFYREDFDGYSADLGDSIRSLLDENHGVGIIGGYYKKDFPLCMVSELTLRMLGYGGDGEFEQNTGCCMTGLVFGEIPDEMFAASDGEYILRLKGKNNNVWTRIVKHDAVLKSGMRIWLASVCDMDALYQKELQVSRITNDKKQEELAHRAEFEKANAELERRKSELEATLSRSELNNEIILAIGRIYQLVFSLDLKSNTYREVIVGGERQISEGASGNTAEAFKTMTERTVMPEFVDGVTKFLDLSTLPDRLKNQTDISHDFKSVMGNWNQIRFIVQKRDSTGKVDKVILTLQIINKQKKREFEYERNLAGITEEAQRANISKSDFLRRMSHDIRTPINGIRGMIEIANHYDGDIVKLRECRQKMWEASGYLLSLVNNVLDMNKLESGITELANEPFDLIELLDEINAVAEMQAVEHGIRFTVKDDNRQIVHRRLVGSPTHIKQILMNIAANAVKYNRENGSITVCCRELECDGDSVTIEFICSDTGIGMSEEFQERMFEPFSQEGRNNARTKYDGSGLGLSIAKGLAEQMGGKIKCLSKIGKGTTFHVTLKLKIDKSEPVPKIEKEPFDGLDGARILVAEDNDLNAEIAKFFIEQNGGKVIEAKNGFEAVKEFENSEVGGIDVILMDIMMPVMNGYEATKCIRLSNRPDGKTVPIIAMSANAFSDDIVQSKNAGMNDHVAKPLSTEKLISTIHTYLGKGTKNDN